MSDMLKILKGFDAVEKKTLNEGAIAECGMTAEAPAAPISINITGDTKSMADILRALSGVQTSQPVMPVAGSFQDDPEIPGQDDVEGDMDLNAGALGTAIGAGLGGVAGLALGGPMGALSGGLAGAATGDQLTDEPYDDPEIPGRDDVEGDTDLQAGVIDTLAGVAGDAIAKGGEIGANLASRAAGAVADTDLGMDAIRRLAGVPNIAPDALVKTGAQAKAADIGSEIGKGAVAIGGPAAALGAVSAMGDDGDEKEVESAEYDATTEPDEQYADYDIMASMSGGINGKKKMYKPASQGDNAMATEMKSRLLAALAEKLDKPADPDPEAAKRRKEIEKHKERKAAKDDWWDDEPKSKVKKMGGKYGTSYNAGDDDFKESKAKPDFLDVDKDGDKKEPMKKALKDKEKSNVKEFTDILKLAGL